MTPVLCRCLFLLWPHHAPRQSSHDNLIRPRCKSASSGVRPAGASPSPLPPGPPRTRRAPPHANPTTAPSPSSHSTHTHRATTVPACVACSDKQQQQPRRASRRVASLSSRDGRRRRAILHPVHARATALPGRPALRGRGGVGVAH